LYYYFKVDSCILSYSMSLLLPMVILHDQTAR
jgi:hypothetical protein